MKGQFRIDADYDLALLPYSPVMQRDLLEIRGQVFNEGDGLCPWIFQARVLEWVANSFSRGSS